ncbi:hypothetical protein CFC21_086137 [Triticum aestivum]|uniref:Serpin domain-containing protein n=2 Tax=Triticum aestivum TaxID=4565 RepID=A0A9R1IFD4_WHEAT|nr:serpin-Z2A-like [Triticum aestivum]KAF7082262.1 hypothetical protein CFC21_086137 [Triticum aestivum]
MEDQRGQTRPRKKARKSKSPPAVGSGGLTAFALRLAKKLAEGDDTRGSNIAFSPLSLYTTLGLVAAGARGTTLDELLALLGASSSHEVAGFVRGLSATEPSGSVGGPLITYAYGVFHQKNMELTPAYLRTAAESYKAEIGAIDFAQEGSREKTRKEINEWAAAATDNLIPEILPEGSLSDGSRLVLTNAIYFKGVWESRFPEALTEHRTFYRLGGASAAIIVPFMTFYPGLHDLFVSYHKDFDVLKLPYKTGDGTARYSMCVFLPHARGGLRAMTNALAARGSLLDHVPKHTIKVTKLLLPKFKLSFFCRLAEVLESLGLRQAFSKEADLSGLVERSVCDVRLDEVFHKAVVEVNEEGTKAVACTAVSGRRKQCARRVAPREFVADHPFAVYIVEEVSGAVVFAGHVLDPSSSSQ